MKPLKERIAIEQAYLDGEKVHFKPNQCEVVGYGGTLKRGEDAVFNWNECDYWVEEKPFEGWVNIYASGACYIYRNEESALAMMKSNVVMKTIKVVEADKLRRLEEKLERVYNCGMRIASFPSAHILAKKELTEIMHGYEQ